MSDNKRYRDVSFFNPLVLLRYLFKKPVTHELKNIVTKKNAQILSEVGIMDKSDVEHSNPRVGPDNIRGFHTNDWEECIGCGTCSDICPTEAIVMTERLDVEEKAGALQERPAIDYGRCCFCALCVDTCTTESLNMSKEYIYANTDPDTFFFLPRKTFLGKEVEKGWQKDSVSDLLDLERIEMDHIDPNERVSNFLEIVRGYSKEYAKQEAARCVECGVCTSSCPVQMHIPEYIKSIWEDDLESGLRAIYETNPLPGVCGRVCTHNCETSCAIAVRGEAIAIRWLKRYIIDSSPDDIYFDVINTPINEKIDNSIAIVGAGPAGLSAAYYLTLMGYSVTVYEEQDLAGGVMRYGIPAYRLPDTAIDKDINFIQSIGAKILTNKKVGKDITLDELKAQNDAVFLGSGFFKPRSLNIPGSEHKNVVGAMDYLPKVRDYERGILSLDDIDVEPSVVVIGGGDVAFDVARSTVRLQMLKYGKADVKLTSLENSEELPASYDELIEGAEEGIEFYCGNGPQEILTKNNKITGLRIWKCLCIFDELGNFNPEFDKECEQIIEGSQVFIAIGQSPDYDYLESISEKLNIQRGKISANKDGQIDSLPWLFVGGDIFRGPDLISAVADGHRSAQAIDEFLYSKAKSKKAHNILKEMREHVKATTPKLTPKQRGL